MKWPDHFKQVSELSGAFHIQVDAPFSFLLYRAELNLEIPFQSHVQIIHRHRESEVNETGNPMTFHAAGDNAIKMLEIWFNIN